MTQILAIIGCALFLAGSLVLAWLEWCDYRSRRTRSIRTELLTADRRVAEAFRAGRRSMNEAAGQSWRNLTD